MRNTDESESDENDEHEETQTTFDSEEICDSQTKIKDWINEIDEEAAQCALNDDDGDRDNIMENQPFAKLFIRLCQVLPLFSAISNKFFDSPNLVGSSWSSETYFKNLKQLHGNDIPCSADVFIKRDIQLTNSSVIKASQNVFSIQSENLDFSENDEPEMPSSKLTPKIKSSTPRQQTQPLPACVACSSGNAPGGAHKCIVCKKSVHPFDGCSVSIGDEEGYGEKRKCMECHYAVEKTKQTTEKIKMVDAKSLNEEEKWTRSKKSKSKYTTPAPNWNLTPMNKKVKIGILQNEVLRDMVYKKGPKNFKMTNTDTIDSVIQLIAAAIAYNPVYRSSIENENYGIFKIAKALAAKYAFYHIFFKN